MGDGRTRGAALTSAVTPRGLRHVGPLAPSTIDLMPYVSPNYASNANAPAGNWVCTRTSSLGPFPERPADGQRHNPDFCGQCVSYVTTVCPDIPVSTSRWTKGGQVKGDNTIAEGTAIATFDAQGQYLGHAAIYVKQDADGIHVHDQWITGTGKAVGARVIRWNGIGVSNCGEGFHVVE